MTEDFSNAPKSITEIRAERSGHAKDQSFRDALVCLLRDIDSGKLQQPDFGCVCIAKRQDNGAVLTNEYVGGPHNTLEVYGLLTRSAKSLMDESS